MGPHHFMDGHCRPKFWGQSIIYKPKTGHLEGVPQTYLGDLLTMVLLTIYKSWGDPPCTTSLSKEDLLRLVRFKDHLASLESMGQKRPNAKFPERNSRPY